MLEVVLFGLPSVFDTALPESLHRILKDFAFFGIRTADINRTIKGLQQAELSRVALLMSGASVPGKIEESSDGKGALTVKETSDRRWRAASELADLCEHLGNRLLAEAILQRNERFKLSRWLKSNGTNIRAGAFVETADRSICRIHCFIKCSGTGNQVAIVTSMRSTSNCVSKALKTLIVASAL